MQNFHYVYILIDTTTETHHYVGSTQDLQTRLAKLNAGEVPHTSKFKPWRIQTAIAFDSKEKTVAFGLHRSKRKMPYTLFFRCALYTSARRQPEPT